MGKIKLSESELIQVIKRIVKESDDESNGPNDNFVIALRNYAKGKITKDDLYDIDDSIYYIEPKTPLGQTMLTIEFKDEEELLNLLEMSDDDIWFMRALNGYDGYDFMDSYQIEQDFKDGYGVYGELDEENVDKLKDLSSILLSGKEFDLDNEDFKIALSQILLDVFPKEIDYILGDFEMEKESEMNAVANKAIKEEFDDVLLSVGANINSGFDRIDIKLSDLYAAALQSNLYNGDAKELVASVLKKASDNNGGGGSFGGWYENSYEYQDPEYFDSKSFNNYVSRQFDEMLESLESNSDDVTGGIKEYLDFKNRISSKFNLNTWLNLPKDKKYKFKIKGFDKDDMKIVVELIITTGKVKEVKLSEENFYHLLYQPSLFNLEEI
jgi:hypothetical protein